MNLKIKTQIFSLLTFLILLGETSAGAGTSGYLRIEEDFQNGDIDYEAALEYKAYFIFDRSKLPPDYQPGGDLPTCGTPHILEIHSELWRLSKPLQIEVTSYFQRPLLEKSYDSPTGNFRIHYNTTGTGAVDPRDRNINRVPDYVEEAAAAFDSAWSADIDYLGYREPLLDGGEGGGDQYDVYIIEMTSRGAFYGFTYPESSRGNTSTSYMEIDNNYTDSIYRQTRGIDALKVTAAHEFFHAIQFAYYDGRDAAWWQEATATWMEDFVYDEINDYFQYLNSFLNSPNDPLDRARGPADIHPNGASLFCHYLVEREEGGEDSVRRTWEELAEARRMSFSAFERSIPGGLENALSEFAVWNFFTGSRAKPDLFYSEGAFYPEVPADDIVIELSKKVAADSRSSRRLGSDYVIILPRRGSGSASISFQGDQSAKWKHKVILLNEQTEVQVLDLTERVGTVTGWGSYEQVALVSTATATTGGPFSYSYEVLLDSIAVEISGPILGQSYPSPFFSDGTKKSTIPVNLDESQRHSAQISIFTFSGELVKTIRLENSDSRDKFRWDGTNQNEELVGSGFYIYQLDAEGIIERRKMAVIRENL